METDSPRYAGLQNADGRPSSAVHNAVPATAETCLGFRIGGLGFLLPVSLHCEVIERLAVNPIPNVAPWFSGLLNIRGNIVPVIDLHIVLGDAVSHDQKRYVFAIGRGEKTVALWIDGYPQMFTDMAQALDTLPALPESLQDCVTGAYWHNGQIWLKVQFEPLFKTLGRQYGA